MVFLERSDGILGCVELETDRVSLCTELGGFLVHTTGQMVSLAENLCYAYFCLSSRGGMDRNHLFSLGHIWFEVPSHIQKWISTSSCISLSATCETNKSGDRYESFAY